MNTLTKTKPQLSKEEQFDQLVAKLKQAGYDMDEPEYNRLQREFFHGRLGHNN